MMVWPEGMRAQLQDRHDLPFFLSPGLHLLSVMPLPSLTPPVEYG
jgi:hypothetical protein